MGRWRLVMAPRQAAAFQPRRTGIKGSSQENSPPPQRRYTTTSRSSLVCRHDAGLVRGLWTTDPCRRCQVLTLPSAASDQAAFFCCCFCFLFFFFHLQNRSTHGSIISSAVVTRMLSSAQNLRIRTKDICGDHSG